jgi:two-component system sensor histidine kinase ChvG
MPYHIAIVEDDIDQQQNYADSLTRKGFTTSCYANVEDALIGIQDNPPDMALLDVVLGDDEDGGFTICRRLLDGGSTLPIIFLTDRSDEIDQVFGLRLGAWDYQTKPISLALLAERIKSLQRIHQARINTPNKPASNSTQQHTNVLSIDAEKSYVSWHGQTIPLTQAHIQEIEAKAIATSLIATQKNIPTLLAANESSELYKHALAAPVLREQIKLDGYLGDWPEKIVELSRSRYHKNYWQAERAIELESAFTLQLAQTAQYLYVGMAVTDSLINYRLNHLRLDYSDHIRLSYRTPEDHIRRIMIPAEREGPLATYFSNHEWEYGLAPSNNLASHETGIQGFWRRTQVGYNAEFRIPIAHLDTQNAQLHIAVVDVDEQPSLGPKAVLATLPPSLDGQFNPLELHAKELQAVIDQLKNTYAHLAIYDRRGREWAFAARDKYSSTFSPNPNCLNGALKGQAQQYQHALDDDSSNKRITICYPIKHNEAAIGVVVIDETASHTLNQHKERLQAIALKTGIAIGSIIFLMFIYAVFLARRITKLSQVTLNAIDSHGRIINTDIKHGKHAPDELGDLSRSISSLLEQQQSYTQFLERIPQTLRHEISNPLNKLRTSLENLIDEQPTLIGNGYVKKLDAGVDQIANITQQLTEAASLESALQKEPLKRLNLSSFLDDYCSAWPGLTSSLPSDEAWIMAESSRLEQLLDKLLDNAFGFCPTDGKVSLNLSLAGDEIQLRVENDGPLIPKGKMTELFMPMTSTRSEGTEVHLGLGLHIAKIIADHHYAKLSCYNREDGSGVGFVVTFRAREGVL